jgi:ABC-2 type transport system ATP-binding protein
VIQTRGLTKRFGVVEAVRDLDLDVRPGTIFGFLGPNGAGKTTTLRMLTGLLRPTSGTAHVAGFDVVSDPVRVKQEVGYLPDNPFLYDHLTVGEFLTFIGDIYGLAAADVRERAAAYLELFDLAAACGLRASELSMGMRKKAVLVAMLVRRPRVLILDEPTSGLDPRAVKALRDLLERLAGDGAAILFSTHILEVAQRISHTIGILSHGRLIACGTMDALRAQASRDRDGASDHDLEEIFLELTGPEDRPDAG